MTLRTFSTNASNNSSMKESLLEGDEFFYAHLVKFERPTKTTSGDPVRGATSYVYVTDAGFDILFDDGSTDVSGSSNGDQLYVANKLISVGSVQETTEARANNVSISLSANALSTSKSFNFTCSTTTITTDVDLVEAGFSEGDTVLLTATGGSNSGKSFRIDSFSTNNTVAVVQELGTALVADATSRAGTLSLESDEIQALFDDKGSSSYASYINRDVFIYKAHIEPTTGNIVGEPYLLFKGIIASGSLKEDLTQSSIITWDITSHWGDFVAVQGRLTSDASHRALTGSGVPDPESVLRPEYVDDLGFLHAEQALNLVSIYQAKELRYRKQTKKKGLFGKKISLIEEEVLVDREVDLRFNLEAKYLPVVYGVQRIDSIPIFVDTLASDPSKVYVIYALCEGEVGGLFDVLIDDTPSICVDKNDFDTRSSQTTEETIDVLCKGRMDRGDVLGYIQTVGADAQTAQNVGNALGIADWSSANIPQLEITPQQESLTAGVDSTFASETNTAAETDGAGIVHLGGHAFETPISAKMIFHAGKSFQRADDMIVGIANANGFKIQETISTTELTTGEKTIVF